MSKSTWREVFETGLYATAGLVSELQDAFPRVVEKGRSSLEPKLTVARFVGQFAFGNAEKEFKRRSESAFGQASEFISLLFGPDSDKSSKEPEDSNSTKTNSPGSRRVTKPVSRPRSASSQGAKAGSLPLTGYTTLSAQQVIARLDSLSASELRKVHGYESLHRKRASVLRAVESKFDNEK